MVQRCVKRKEARLSHQAAALLATRLQEAMDAAQSAPRARTPRLDVSPSADRGVPASRGAHGRRRTKPSKMTPTMAWDRLQRFLALLETQPDKENVPPPPTES